MPSIDDVPLYNLRAVVQETGLTADALRAWERRYGLPHPSRTSGGHRVYSHRDIDTLKWLVSRQEEGLAISKAASLWNRLVGEGHDPLKLPEYAVARPAVDSHSLVSSKRVTDLCENWVSACLDFDEQRADQTLAQAFALYPAELVCIGVLQEGLAKVGLGWYQGEVSVQQEHFASELAMRRLEALVLASPQPTRSRRILAACPPGEDHVFGLLMITFLLRRQGWPVLHLGANVPIEELLSSMADGKIRLVVTVAQHVQSVATLVEMARVVRDQGVPLAYGGRIFSLNPALTKRVPGYFMGEQLDEAPRIIEQLLESPPSLPVEDVPDILADKRRRYRLQIPLVETDVEELMQGAGMPPSHLSSANEDLARVIPSALALGDAGLLTEEVEWLKGRLDHQGVAPQVIHHYLQTYFRALRERMDSHGDPILARFGDSI